MVNRHQPEYLRSILREVSDHEPQAEGWFEDPYLLHEHRWFSSGTPTKLVRDEGRESYDPAPDSPASRPLVEVSYSSDTRSSVELLRADDPEGGADKNQAQTALDVIAETMH
jgi:hypothetical protein